MEAPTQNPIPKASLARRAWALRQRKLLMLGVLLALMLALRLVWGWLAARQAESVLVALRARGQPISVTDVVYPPVPEAENAWSVYSQAIRAVLTGIDSPRNTNLEYGQYPPYPPEWHLAARASEAAHGQAFVLARQARDRKRVQFRRGLTSPVHRIMLPYLHDTRHLANTLGDGAIHAHLSGDDAEAVERLNDLLHLAWALRHDEFVFSQLVANGIEAVACGSAQVIAPALDLGSQGATRPAKKPTNAKAVRSLIDRLLDEAPAKKGLEQSLLTLQLQWIEAVRTQSEKCWVIRPLADRELVRFASVCQASISSVRQDSEPAADQALRAIEWPGGHDGLSRLLGGRAAQKGVRYSQWFGQYTSDVRPYLKSHFRSIAQRRATALALAVQLYRADHGQFPGQVEELVPAYLPEVPLDPHLPQRKLSMTIQANPAHQGRTMK